MEQSLTSAIIGGAAVLIGKIIWDWLTGLRKKSDESVKHAGDCARLTALENQFHAAHLSLAKDVAEVKGDIGMMKTDLGYIKRKLDLNGKDR